MEKMTVAQRAEMRKEFYAIVEGAVTNAGLDFEPIATGILVDAGDGRFVEVRVIVKDEEKFDLIDARQEYADKCKAAADRAEKSAKLAAEREKKAAEKAAKAQKAAEVTEG